MEEEEENQVVRFSVCPAVLHSLPGLVVSPALHAPVGDSVTFYCVFYYMSSYIIVFLLIYILFPHLCCELQATCSYGDFRPGERRGFLLDCSSRLCIDTVFMWLGALTDLSTVLFRVDIHSVAWPCLPHPWNSLAFPVLTLGRLFRFALVSSVWSRLFQTYASPPTLTIDP